MRPPILYGNYPRWTRSDNDAYNAAQAIKSLACGFSPRARTSRLFAMLTAHIDDSGSEPQGQVCVLAGFVGLPDNWEAFTRKWCEALSESPAIDYFKASEAESLKEQFAGFSREQANQKIDNLVAVILDKRFDLHKLDCVCGWRNYNSEMKGRLHGNELLDHPYFWTFYKLILAETSFQRRHRILHKVDFIFDDQGRLGNVTREYYKQMPRIVGPEVACRLGSEPIFRDEKKEVVALQAADLYAWHLHRYLCDQFIIKGLPMRTPLKAIHAMVGESRQITRDDMRMFVKKVLKGEYPRTYPE